MSQLNEPHGAIDGLVRVYPADAATRPTPGLVWAHGGGFAGGDLDMPEAHWVAGALAERGVTVVSVDYRLAGDGCRYPVPSDDVLAAWRWTLEHVDELGIDTDRLAIGGASAGANLAAGAVLRLLAAGGRVAPGEAGRVSRPLSDVRDLDTAAPSSLPTRSPGEPGLPAGVFLAYPTLLAVQPAPDASLRALLDANPGADRFKPASVRAMYETYLGGPVESAPLPAVPGLATPDDVRGFPPTLMINGEADELRVSGEVFAATLAAAEVPIELHIEPGTEHGHLNRPDAAAASDSLDRVVRWIATLTDIRITEGSPS
ncbi:alpha/beta hydrolase [Agromyces albus]|uniref:Alpha/beta hydrolase n=1 Tax=Agromyces albus TaxID=205332 RepID=A0A4Q2KV70_9MICO|nr:alpha/beta hydrolase fold domain-containing protein [Agromyces albus]RXZ67693.1 alpha/beta hydrolase [Agromyces albus]